MRMQNCGVPSGNIHFIPGADTFLLLRDARYLAGVLLFCVVQGLYLARILRENGAQAAYRSVIGLLFLTNPLYHFAAPLSTKRRLTFISSGFVELRQPQKEVDNFFIIWYDIKEHTKELFHRLGSNSRAIFR